MSWRDDIGFTEAAEARFWTYVPWIPVDGICWPWTGARWPTRYGRLTVRYRSLKAHRLSWALTHNRWPDSDEFVCHHCDNPPCVRPDHLFLGDAFDNMADMVSKGRGCNYVPTLLAACKHGHDLTLPGARLVSRTFPSGQCRECYDNRKREARERYALNPERELRTERQRLWVAGLSDEARETRRMVLAEQARQRYQRRKLAQ